MIIRIILIVLGSMVDVTKLKACFPLVTENSKQFVLVNGQTQCSNRLLKGFGEKAFEGKD